MKPSKSHLRTRHTFNNCEKDVKKCHVLNQIQLLVEVPPHISVRYPVQNVSWTVMRNLLSQNMALGSRHAMLDINSDRFKYYRIKIFL